MPEAGDEKVRGVPKAVTKGGAVKVPPPAVAKLKAVVLTVTTLARLKMLKASRMRRSRTDSLNGMLRVMRASSW